MEFYDYDPKYGNGDGGIEYRTISRRVVLGSGDMALSRSVELIPYDGTERVISISTTAPTFNIDNPWHNRPA